MAFEGFKKNPGPSFPPKSNTQFGNFPPSLSPSPSPPPSHSHSHSHTLSPPSSFYPFNHTTPSQRSPRFRAEMGSLFESGVPQAPQRGSHPMMLGRNPSNASYPFQEAQRPSLSPPRWGTHPKSFFNASNIQTHQGPASGVPYADPPYAGTARHANFQDPRRTRSPSDNKVFLENYTRDVSERDLGAPQRLRSPPVSFNSSHSSEDPHHQFGEARRWPTEPSTFQAPKRTRSPPSPSANETIWKRSHSSQGDADRDEASPPRLGNSSNLLGSNATSTVPQRSSLFSPHNVTEGAGSKTLNSQVPKRNRSPSLPSAEQALPGTSYSTVADTERETQAKAKRLARFGVELSQPVQKNIDHVKNKLPANRHEEALVERRKVVTDQPVEPGGDFMLSDYEGPESSSVIIGLCPDMCPESEREERERKGDLDKYERLDGDRNQSSLSLAVKKYNRTAEREADLIRPMPVLQKTIDYLLALLDHPYDDRFLGMYNFLWDRLRAIRMDLRMQHIFNQDAITMLEQMIRLHIVAMHELCEYTKGEGFSEGFDAHLNIEQMNKTSVELFQMYDDHRKKGSAVVSEKEFRGYYALLKLDKHPGYKVEPAELSLDLAKMTPEIRQTPEILFARDVARACRTSNFIAFFRLARKATYLQACLMHAHFAKLRTQALASLHSGLQSNQGIPITHVTKWLGMEEEDIDGLVEYHGFSIKEFEELYMVKEGPFLNSDKDYPTKCSQLVHLKKSTAIVDDVSSFHSLAWPSEISGQILPDKVVKSPLFDTVDEVMLTSEEDPAPTVGSPVQEIFELPTTGPDVRSVCQVAPVWVALSPKKSQDSAAAEVGKVGTPTRELFRNDSLERILHSNAQGFSQQSVSRTTPLPMLSPQSVASKVVKVGTPTRETLRNDSLERTLRSNVQGFELKSTTGTSQQSERSKGSSFHPWVESSIPQLVINPHENEEALIVHQEVEGEEPLVYHDDVEEEENVVMIHQDNEVATAKLKLLLRTWKRLSSKRKKLREQRQLEANAALSSLSLGPPIQQIRAPSIHVRELDIDRSVRERGERYRKSWTRLNISEVVGGMLSEKNPDAKCLCWKLVVCSPESVIEGDKFVQKTQSNQLASRWLHSKLMGVATENDDELVALSLDLSIWKKWVPHQYDRHPICCFSVIRTANLNMLEHTVGGAGAVLFLLSENIPLDHQKTQLHNLSMSLPSGSCVPLLILCGRFKEGSISPSMISNGLSLHYLDKTRISGFSVVSLMDDQPAEHLDGFFSTNRLKEGLQWLASQSFIQPVVHFIKTRDLVMDHLSSSLEMLENINISIVGPNHCISEFNQALDRSATEVYTAAETDPSSWPCPEISLLESSSDCRVVESFLPIIGWSSAAIIKPIVSRIQSCKLPFFPDDLSWLSDGSDMGEKILHHKSELEKCLIRYLTDLSQMMDKALGTTEACVMLQKGATLELQGSNYHITPKWVTIFRRIFNWRLMNLFSGVGSEAYILERRDPIVKSVTSSEEFNTDAYSPALHALESMEFEADGLCPFSLSQPSLDEMVGVCFSTCEFGTVQLQPEAIQAPSMTVNHVKEPSCTANADDDLENEENRQHDVESTQTGDVYLSGDLSRRVILDDYVSGELVLANKGKKEADKLSKLFEQCNIVQNKIDEHLSIYF